MRNLARIIALMLVAGLIVAGCGGDSTNGSSDTLPDAQTVLNQGAAQLQEATAFSYELDVDGYPVEIPATGLDLTSEMPLVFKYAKGTFQVPDRLYASIQFSVGDFSTTAELIAIDHEHYFRGELLTANHWINQELIHGFTPASLVAQPGGIAAALGTIANLELLGKQDLDGINAFHLRGTIQASAVYSLTFGLIRTTEGTLAIEAYVQVSDQRVVQIVLREPAPGDATDQEATTWRMTLSDYNEDVTIDAPAMAENGS